MTRADSPPLPTKNGEPASASTASMGIGGIGAWVERARLASSDIKLSHSVFALPFAVLGAVLAHTSARGEDAASGRVFAGQLGLVVMCMVLARTWAMLVNRVVDREIDAANPRTQRRVLASGKLGATHAKVMMLATGAGFVGACSGFYWLHGNAWPIRLSVPVLGFIAFYSFTKRFTWGCHLFLGLALAISPLAAAIAVRPGAVTEFEAIGSISAQGFGVGLTLMLLAGMVWLWVAGFDVIYALQDIGFDRSHRLYSIPSRLGATGAIWVSRGFHAAAFGMLALAGASHWSLGWIFDAGIGLVGVLLIAEHVILSVRGKAGLDMAFFTLNGVVSCVLGAAGVIDLTI